MARWWNGIHTVRLQRDGRTLLRHGTACRFEPDPRPQGYV